VFYLFLSEGFLVRSCCKRLASIEGLLTSLEVRHLLFIRARKVKGELSECRSGNRLKLVAKPAFAFTKSVSVFPFDFPSCSLAYLTCLLEQGIRI